MKFKIFKNSIKNRFKSRLNNKLNLILTLVLSNIIIFNAFTLNAFALTDTIGSAISNSNFNDNANTSTVSNPYYNQESYIITSFPLTIPMLQELSSTYNANFYNIVLDIYDTSAVENIIPNILNNNNNIQNLLISFSIDDNYMYNKQTDYIKNNKNNNYLNYYDIVYIDDVDTYLDTNTSFLNYTPSILNSGQLDNLLNNIDYIKTLCNKNNIDLTIVSNPIYYDYDSTAQENNNKNINNIKEFYTQLAEITDFWDFSVSSLSLDPRYFYNPTNFRLPVFNMIINKINNNEFEYYIPDDFGVYINNNINAKQGVHIDNYLDGLSESIRNNNDFTQIKTQIQTTIPILMYHHFDETGNTSTTMNIDNFENQIKTLSESGFNSIDFDDLLNYVNKGIDLPEKPFIITIDDGYTSNYELAYPILEKYNTKATIFVIGTSVDKAFYKDTENAIIPHFSYEQAQEMINSGLISIQSHTYDMHQWQPFEEDLARTTVSQLTDESDEDYIDALIYDFSKVKSDIEENTTEIVNILSYPLGTPSKLSEIVLNFLDFDITLLTGNDYSTIVKGLPQSLLGLKRFNISDEISAVELVELIERVNINN